MIPTLIRIDIILVLVYVYPSSLNFPDIHLGKYHVYTL